VHHKNILPSSLFETRCVVGKFEETRRAGEVSKIILLVESCSTLKVRKKKGKAQWASPLLLRGGRLIG
jgi:hypothetical protein